MHPSLVRRVASEVERTRREEISYNTSIVSRAALRLSSVGGIALMMVMHFVED
jgi:hypothetical protein